MAAVTTLTVKRQARASTRVIGRRKLLDMVGSFRVRFAALNLTIVATSRKPRIACDQREPDRARFVVRNPSLEEQMLNGQPRWPVLMCIINVITHN